MQLEREKLIIDDIKSIFTALIRFLVAVFVFSLISFVLYFIDFEDNYLFGDSSVILGLLFTLPLVYSLVRATTIFDEKLHVKFLEKPERSLKAKINLLFRYIQFWIEIIAFAVLYLILPIEWTAPAYAHLFLGWHVTFDSKLMLMAIIFPLFFILNVLGRFSAVDYWYVDKNGRAKQKKEKAKRKLIFIIEILKAAIIYGFGGFILKSYIPLFLSITPIFKEVLTVKIIIAIIILILLSIAFRYLRAIRKRKSFIKKFTAICRENGFQASEISNPIRSLFSVYKGNSFDVSLGEKRYSCKLISALNSKIPLEFYPEGYCKFIHSIRLLKTEVYQYSRTYEFGYEADCKKILVVNPTPKTLMQVISGRRSIIDNGEVVGKYKIYTGTAFLNALERDCLDK